MSNAQEINSVIDQTTASEIAQYVISRFHELEEPITNMKVQKLLYYIQGWHLGLYSTSAFQEELQAWRHGPVQAEVYDQYKAYRWNPIEQEVSKPNIASKLIDHIEQVLDCYGGKNAFALEVMTHKESPWLEARGDLAQDQNCQNSISVESMREYFANRVKENEETHNYEPNQETIRVLEASKKGEGVIKINYFLELAEQLQFPEEFTKGQDRTRKDNIELTERFKSEWEAKKNLDYNQFISLLNSLAGSALERPSGLAGVVDAKGHEFSFPFKNAWWRYLKYSKEYILIFSVVDKRIRLERIGAKNEVLNLISQLI